MRAFSRYSMSTQLSGIRDQYMGIFRKKCDPSYKLSDGFVVAPPRQLLKVFGGTMSIAEFRALANEKATFSVLPPRMRPLVQILEEQRSSTRQRAQPVHNLADPVSFKDVQGKKNESLRLRRSKPMKSDKNVLERAMGINAFLVQSKDAKDVSSSTSS